MFLGSAEYLPEEHFFFSSDTRYAEPSRVRDSPDKVSPSHEKEATAFDGVEGPLVKSNLACNGVGTKWKDKDMNHRG